jgi:hypothetical protein
MSGSHRRWFSDAAWRTQRTRLIGEPDLADQAPKVHGLRLEHRVAELGRDGGGQGASHGGVRSETVAQSFEGVQRRGGDDWFRAIRPVQNESTLDSFGEIRSVKWGGDAAVMRQERSLLSRQFSDIRRVWPHGIFPDKTQREHRP